MPKRKQIYPGARPVQVDNLGYFTTIRKRINGVNFTSPRLRGDTIDMLILNCKTWDRQIGFDKMASERAEQVRLQSIYTVEKFLLDYTARAIGSKNNKWSANTIQDAKYIVKTILSDKTFSQLELIKVTRRDVKAFLATERFKGLQERHLKITRFLKTAFNIAIKDDDKELLPPDITLEINPVIGIPCTTSYTPVKPLDDEHEAALLKYVQGVPVWGALITLVLDAGFRFQELAGLQLRDITPSENLITLSRTVDTISGKAILKNSMKSKSSARPVHIAPETMKLLLNHCVSEGVIKPTQHIFTNDNGGMLDARWFWTRWKQLLKDANIPTTYTFHQLRHTQIHRDLKDGNFDAVVSARAGHSSITVTKDRYSASLTKHQKTITAGFGKHLQDVTGSKG